MDLLSLLCIGRLLLRHKGSVAVVYVNFYLSGAVSSVDDTMRSLVVREDSTRQPQSYVPLPALRISGDIECVLSSATSTMTPTNVPFVPLACVTDCETMGAPFEPLLRRPVFVLSVEEPRLLSVDELDGNRSAD